MTIAHLTQAERNRIAELVDDGLSLHEISARMDRGYETVRTWAYRLRPGMKAKRQPWTEDEEWLMVYELKADTSWESIAAQLHRSSNACQIHYQEMLARTKGTDSQAKILLPDKYGNARRTKSVKPVHAVYKPIDPTDLYGLWCRAMQSVRSVQNG
jgi:IS30 family transposase